MSALLHSVGIGVRWLLSWVLPHKIAAAIALALIFSAWAYAAYAKYYSGKGFFTP